MDDDEEVLEHELKRFNPFCELDSDSDSEEVDSDDEQEESQTKGKVSRPQESSVSCSDQDVDASSSEEEEGQDEEEEPFGFDDLPDSKSRNGQVVSEKMVECMLKVIGVEAASAKPTKIQSECWNVLFNPITSERDVIAISRTGSGKTWAFLLPVLTELKQYEQDSDPTGLILAPTRELAQQTYDVAQQFQQECKDELGCRIACVVGGVSYTEQVEALKELKPTLIVATPGRLVSLCGFVPHNTKMRQEQQLGHVEEMKPVKCVDLKNVCELVLDEADRMLDLGFAEDLKQLSKVMKKMPRFILTSATWSDEIDDISTKVFGKTREAKPIFIQIEGAGLSAAKTVTQRVEVIKQKGAYRFKRLVTLIRDEFKKDPESMIIVFVLHKAEAKQVAKDLCDQDLEAVALQGDMSQTARQAAMEKYKSEDSIRILVATDVAARGLDVDGVTLVVNYSLGLSIENYVHRVGRCGRAGKFGTAHTFLVKGDEKLTPELMKILEDGNQQVPVDLRIMATKEQKKRERKQDSSSGGTPTKAKQALDEDAQYQQELQQANREKQMKLRQAQLAKSGTAKSKRGRNKKKH